MNKRNARLIRQGVTAANSIAAAPANPLARAAYTRRMLQLIGQGEPRRRAGTAMLFARHAYAA